MAAYDQALHLYNELNQLHFELLLLAYGAYLTFFQFCQSAFPDMGLQTMSQMIAGFDTTMMRPDDELKALAAKAIELGVDGAFAEGRSAEEILAELEASERRPRVDRRPRGAQAPVVHDVDRRRLLPPPSRLGGRPAAAVHGDRRLHRAAARRAGHRPAARAAARRAGTDRRRVRDLLATDEERAQFTEMLGLCRHVFPHAESHKFFIEHWGTSLFFNAIRKVGAVLAENGFFPEADDIFYLNIHEVHEALSDVGLAWAGGTAGAGHRLLAAARRRVARRSSRRSPSGCRRRRSASFRR